MPNHLELALAAFATLRTPGRIASALRREGLDALSREHNLLSHEIQDEINQKASELAQDGVEASIFSTATFPSSLIQDQTPIAPILFHRGNRDLLYRDAIGMCGSRHVSPRGLEAASRCGTLATQKGLTVVSGYAAGVDTATHLAALRNHGSTVIVLAEGISHFRIKRAFQGAFDWDHTLVISQFSPNQPWRAHSAMARNGIIFGLPKALLVIEAGEKGGTLAAGEGALKMGRTVIAVDFGEETPPGNRQLMQKGAESVRTAPELRAAFDRVCAASPVVQRPTLF